MADAVAKKEANYEFWNFVLENTFKFAIVAAIVAALL